MIDVQSRPGPMCEDSLTYPSAVTRTRCSCRGCGRGPPPKQIAECLIDENYPNATAAYEISDAMVGYEPGYGVVANEYPHDSSGTFTHLRLVVMVAVRGDYALVGAAIGPFHEFSPDFGTGHPSGVNLQLAMGMGKYVNSFQWLRPA